MNKGFCEDFKMKSSKGYGEECNGPRIRPLDGREPAKCQDFTTIRFDKIMTH